MCAYCRIHLLYFASLFLLSLFRCNDLQIVMSNEKRIKDDSFYFCLCNVSSSLAATISFAVIKSKQLADQFERIIEM